MTLCQLTLYDMMSDDTVWHNVKLTSQCQGSEPQSLILAAVVHWCLCLGWRSGSYWLVAQPLSTAILSTQTFTFLLWQLSWVWVDIEERRDTLCSAISHVLSTPHNVAKSVSLWSCIILVKLFNLKNNQLSLYQTECQVAIMTSLGNMPSIPVCDEKR